MPLFLVWLVLGLGVLLALRVMVPAWHGRSHVFHGLIWSSVGMVLANARLWAGLLVGATASGRTWPQLLAKAHRPWLRPSRPPRTVQAPAGMLPTLERVTVRRWGQQG